ncbi:hypothetical protein TrST_g8249, partial [Triparma strigata]
MALLFKTLDQKNVDYVDNVNAFLEGLLHKEDERETKEENGEAAVCAICKESEPNAKILPCGHSASCSVCTQKVIDVGNGSGKCPFCREEFERFEVGKWSNTTGAQGLCPTSLKNLRHLAKGEGFSWYSHDLFR